MKGVNIYGSKGRPEKNGRLLCGRCKKFRQRKFFHPSLMNKYGLQATCKSCMKVNNYEYNIKSKGLTIKEYEELIKTQKTCSICDKNPNGRYKILNMDHNHLTKKFRGLLCMNCNMIIGLIHDDPNLISKIANYLEPKVTLREAS